MTLESEVVILKTFPFVPWKRAGKVKVILKTIDN